MKYELTGIGNGAIGETQLLLRHSVWIGLADIPWAAGRLTRLYLHPANLAELPRTVADNVQLLPKDALPIFSRDELETVLHTVEVETRRIQARNLKPFRFVAEAAKSVVSIADLVVKAVVTPGEKTGDGLLIEAIAVPWLEIIETLSKDPNLAFQIPPHKWEEIIAGAYKRAAFDEVTLTPRSADLGRDVIAVKRGLGWVRVVDQVKAYKPGHLVKADAVRALYGVVELDHASKGFLTTTSDFAPRLMDDPLLKLVIPSRLELINGTALLRRLEELVQKKRGRWKPLRSPAATRAWSQLAVRPSRCVNTRHARVLSVARASPIPDPQCAPHPGICNFNAVAPAC